MKLILLILTICPVFIHGLGGRKPGLVGGFRQINLTSNSLSAEDRGEIDRFTTYAIKEMNKAKTEEGTNNAMPISLKNVLSYSVQLVAGQNVLMTLLVSIDGQNKVCNLLATNLYSWENGGIWSLKAVSDNDPCGQFIPKKPKQRRSVPILGGQTTADANDVMVQQAAQWAVKHINQMSNSMSMQSLLKVTDVTKQVVNGLRIKFHLTTVFTSCRNKPENHHKTLEECPVTKDPKPQDCQTVVIFSQEKYTMESFNCKPHKEAIGGDDHDYVPHGKDIVKRMSILGGDTHDYISHGGGICAEYVQAFKEFKNKFNRLYGSADEDNLRFKIFCDNMEKVKVIQSAEQGSAVYGATIFADLSAEEFRKRYMGFKPPVASNRQWPQAKIPKDDIPDNWDWRDHNAVTPVKNQGYCGSCWAFSTTGNIEGQWAIHSQSKNLLSLSEQELVDCDKLDQGCNGGFMYDAYEAIINLGGIETESDYKYTGQDQKCRFNRSDVVVKLTGAVNISKDEGEMAAWLYKNGPISIGINAFPMQFYLWGIAHPWKFFCDPNALDHGVLIVGYGKQGNEPYWIIKNSWGPSWGRHGYYYIYRGDGSCGLNTMCSSATVD